MMDNTDKWEEQEIKMHNVTNRWHYMNNSEKAEFIIDYFSEEIIDRLKDREIINIMESDHDFHNDVFIRYSEKESE
jgi:hypothetical protein